MIQLFEILSFLLQLAYVFVLLNLIHAFLPLRENTLIRLAAFLVGNLLFTAVIYSNDFAGLFGALLGMSVYIAVFHQGHWLEKITGTLLFYPALIAINYLMQDMGSRGFFFVTGAPKEISFGWTQEQLWISTLFFTLSLLLRLLFWILSWKILRKYLKQVASNLTVKMWIVVDVLMLAPFTAILTIIYFMPENPWVVYPICGTSIFSSFGCMYLASYLSDSIRTAYYAQELETKQTYYRQRIHDEERVRSVYHDMKNHLLVLERQQQSPETSGMIEKLQQEVMMYEDYVHTGNEILDIILKEKAESARERQIDFSVTVDFNGIDFMDPLDISTIFGNGLDNAIEASEKLSGKKRAILVKAGRVRNFLSILIENNCSGECTASKSHTTKQDHFLHGFGISNMKKATEKYGGQLITKCERGTFTLKILIPIP